tara:strand:+ start:2077 stop:2517 length:441 start_codon:yes stop_codon:yes gene_type:complete
VRIVSESIKPFELRNELIDSAAGAYVGFEGWVRNHNDGQEVYHLEYEVYEFLAVKEGEKVISEAKERHPILRADCVHRSGLLEIGECAVWVGVISAHRDEAFAACRYIIDEIKTRLPIWKKEYYSNGDSGWVNCERCATHEQKAAS